MSFLSTPHALSLSGTSFVQHDKAENVLHEWTSEEFLDGLENWVDLMLDQQFEWEIVETPIQRLGPLALHRMRFWSGLWTVPTSIGQLWVKQCPPGQRFEADLTGYLDGHLGEHVPQAMETCPACGTILSYHLPGLLDDSCSEKDYDSLGRQIALMQKESRSLVEAIKDTELHWTNMFGTIDLPLEDAANYAQHAIDQLFSLPAEHFQHLPADQARSLSARVGEFSQKLQLLTDAVDAVSFQPGDMHTGNVYRKNAADAAKTPDAPFWFSDFGDAVNSHPFGVLHSLLWLPTDSYPNNPNLDHPMARMLANPYLEGWGLDPGEAFDAGVVEAGVRLGALHRFESWRRLIAATQPASLGDNPPRLSHYLSCALV